MKIAITSTGNSLNAIIDSRFGRCSYFAIYNTDDETTSFIKNPNKESLNGAGPASVKFLATNGVEKIISGEFGGKAQSILNDLKIQMIVFDDTNKSLNEIVESLKQ